MSDVSLKQQIFFLHGLSGAGKGSLEEVLSLLYQQSEYITFAVSTGELFREAKGNPTIAAQMQSGKFPETLEYVTPGLKKYYRDFLKASSENNGKAILILDGAVRRTAIPEKNIPSQLEQIATAFWQVQQEMRINTHQSVAEIVSHLHDSRHCLIDVNPEDAEQQMQIRVKKELAKLRDILSLTQENEATYVAAAGLLEGLIDVVEKVVLLAQEHSEYELLEQRYGAVRSELFRFSTLSLVPSLAEVFGKLQIESGLRDDDITAGTRGRRIKNLLVKTDQGYMPGFAAEALAEVGIIFSVQEQRFVVEAGRENCVVIQNGSRKGIDFPQFQTNCLELAEHFVATDEQIHREGAEHQAELHARKSKET